MKTTTITVAGNGGMIGVSYSVDVSYADLPEGQCAEYDVLRRGGVGVIGMKCIEDRVHDVFERRWLGEVIVVGAGPLHELRGGRVESSVLLVFRNRH